MYAETYSNDLGIIHLVHKQNILRNLIFSTPENLVFRKILGMYQMDNPLLKCKCW